MSLFSLDRLETRFFIWMFLVAVISLVGGMSVGFFHHRQTRLDQSRFILNSESERAESRIVGAIIGLRSESNLCSFDDNKRCEAGRINNITEYEIIEATRRLSRLGWPAAWFDVDLVRSGKFMFHVGDGRVIKQDPPKEWDEHISNCLKERASFAETSDNAGRLVLLSCRNIAQSSWVVIVSLVTPTIYDDAYTAVRSVLIVLLVGLLLIAVGVRSLSGSLLAPLQKLSMSMKSFADGDYEARAKIDQLQEFAFLETHFNEMAEKLANVYRGLKSTVFEANRELETVLADKVDLTHYVDSALQSMFSGFISFSARGRITGVNKQAEEIFGLGDVASDERSDHFLRLAEQGGIGEAVERVIESGDPVQFVVENFRPPNAKRDKMLEFRIAPISDLSKGSAAGAVAIINDVTRQYKLEKRLKRQDRSEMIETLSSGIAHEIRNPLNSIGLQMLLMQRRLEGVDSEKSGRLYPLIDVVLEEVNRLNDLVKQFLALAEPEAHQLKLQPLMPVLEEVYLELGERAEENGVWFSLEPGPEVSAPIDRAKIKRAVGNLVVNAFEATEKSGGHVSVELSSEGNEAHIRIIDDGDGVSEEVARRMFNIFYSTREMGAGLGLTLADQIVSAHGGRIVHENAAEGGAIFTIALPLKIAEVFDIHRDSESTW